MEELPQSLIDNLNEPRDFMTRFVEWLNTCPAKPVLAGCNLREFQEGQSRNVFVTDKFVKPLRGGMPMGTDNHVILPINAPDMCYVLAKSANTGGNGGTNRGIMRPLPLPVKPDPNVRDPNAKFFPCKAYNGIRGRVFWCNGKSEILIRKGQWKLPNKGAEGNAPKFAKIETGPFTDLLGVFSSDNGLCFVGHFVTGSVPNNHDHIKV
jgi:hypothetical protein